MSYPYLLPKLPYAYNALEPYIDARTMEIHYTKHHQAYTDKMNAILEQYPNLQDTSIAELLHNIATCGISDDHKQVFINNAGGYLNHTLFWETMGPEKDIDDPLVAEITKTFGSLESFKDTFETNAKSQFGSGWSWLVRNANGQLEAYSTTNQDSPYLKGHTPILGLDVWEHAYYLQYQNKRPDYVSAWWQVCRLLP